MTLGHKQAFFSYRQQKARADNQPDCFFFDLSRSPGCFPLIPSGGAGVPRPAAQQARERMPAAARRPARQQKSPHCQSAGLLPFFDLSRSPGCFTPEKLPFSGDPAGLIRRNTGPATKKPALFASRTASFFDLSCSPGRYSVHPANRQWYFIYIAQSGCAAHVFFIMDDLCL